MVLTLQDQENSSFKTRLTKYIAAIGSEGKKPWQELINGDLVKLIAPVFEDKKKEKKDKKDKSDKKDKKDKSDTKKKETAAGDAADHGDAGDRKATAGDGDAKQQKKEKKTKEKKKGQLTVHDNPESFRQPSAQLDLSA